MLSGNCAISSMAPYTPSSEEWTSDKIAYLYRRLGFGATLTQIQDGLTRTPSELVDLLMDEAINTPLPDIPYWSEYTSEDYDNDPNEDLAKEHYRALKDEWIERMMTHTFRTKMSMFWHNHFVTEEDVYGCNHYAYNYYYTLNQYAFGNFRTFVEVMGLTPAMLVYLDGNDNRRQSPNENYARELMELFTMGEDNGYTQTDIEEMARALTGFRVIRSDCTPMYFDNNRYDDGVKTIFGQSGNWNYDDVHELIFTLRKNQVAKFICGKLYKHFVYEIIDEEVVDVMAQTFMDNNWEIEPVIRQLLKSEHFFDANFPRSHIKSPLEMFMNVLVPFGFDIATDFEEDIFEYMDNTMDRMGQEIFNPPNVAGWPGHRDWLNENALTNRWTYSRSVLNNYINDLGKEKLRTLAMALTDNSNDPTVISEAMASHVLGSGLDEQLIAVATLYLKGGIPENYFEDGTWNLYWEEAPDQLINLFNYLIQIPEFQLS